MTTNHNCPEWPGIDDIKKHWPDSALPISEQRAREVHCSISERFKGGRWGWRKCRDTSVLRSLIRRMFPIPHKGEYAIPQKGFSSGGGVSAGPFRHGCGGGRRVIWKASGMS